MKNFQSWVRIKFLLFTNYFYDPWFQNFFGLSHLKTHSEIKSQKKFRYHPAIDKLTIVVFTKSFRLITSQLHFVKFAFLVS